MLFKKHMLTDPIVFKIIISQNQHNLSGKFKKTNLFSKLYFSATIIARDIIFSSGCREFSPEHSKLLGFF